MNFRLPKIFLLAVAAMASWDTFHADPAGATPVTVTFNFNLTCAVNAGAGGCGGSNLDGPDGNIRFFTGSDGSTTVHAEAWSFTGNTDLSGTTNDYNNTAETAWLGQYLDTTTPFTSSGLGVTNRDSQGSDFTSLCKNASSCTSNGGDGTGSNNQHTMDDVGRLDFITFLFNRKVNLYSFLLDAFTQNSLGPDSDIQVWVGNLATATDAGVATAVNNKLITDFTLSAALGGLGLTNATNTGSDDRTASFASVSPTLTGNFIILAPYPQAGSYNDMLKVSTMTTTVPEPPTVFSMLGGLLGLFALIFFSRRRPDLNSSQR